MNKLLVVLAAAIITTLVVNWVLDNSTPQLMQYSGTGGMVAGAIVAYLVWSKGGVKKLAKVLY